MASLLEQSTILTALQSGDINLEGQFLLGSNYTFLAQLTWNDITFPVVYKPSRGERPLWDFPTGSLAKREAAVFIINQALGWNLVPPIIYRKKGPLGAGSLQIYIDHDPEYHYFRFNLKDRQRLRSTALFDIIINNADRKGGHILVGSEDGHLWLIDHGICLHCEDKLRTVIWDFIGEPIPENFRIDLMALAHTLNNQSEVTLALRKLIKVGEIKALKQRIERLLEGNVFPGPTSRYSIPYPPV